MPPLLYASTSLFIFCMGVICGVALYKIIKDK